MRKAFFIAATFLFCQTTFADLSWQPLKEAVLKADLATSRKDQLEWAKKAIVLADQCVAENPNEAACYYYRGQATGLYYEIKMFGYQNGVRSMIQDWQKALELDPKFDRGGPNRMFGELYTGLPKFFGTKDLRQDLTKAQIYLYQSIAIEPNYPTQHLDLAEAFLKNKKPREAKEALQKGKSLMTQCSSDPYFARWQQTVKELHKKLNGKE